MVTLTAWHMLMTRARLQPGEDVLVLAASSGVGACAIQIAKLFQCRVIATAGGEEKLAKARELGADHTIDHYRQDISAEVKKITAPPRRGCRGGTRRSRHLGEEPRIAGARRPPGHLRRHHRLRCLHRPALSLHQTVQRPRLLMGTMGELTTALKFVFRGLIRPVIDRVYPLAEIRAAHVRLERKEQFGKILVKP